MEHLFNDILDKDEQIVKVIKPSKSRCLKAPIMPFAIPIFWPHLILFMVLTLFTLPFFICTAIRICIMLILINVLYEKELYELITKHLTIRILQPRL